MGPRPRCDICAWAHARGDVIHVLCESDAKPQNEGGTLHVAGTGSPGSRRPASLLPAGPSPFLHGGAYRGRTSRGAASGGPRSPLGKKRARAGAPRGAAPRARGAAPRSRGEPGARLSAGPQASNASRRRAAGAPPRAGHLQLARKYYLVLPTPGAGEGAPEARWHAVAPHLAAVYSCFGARCRRGAVSVGSRRGVAPPPRVPSGCSAQSVPPVPPTTLARTYAAEVEALPCMSINLRTLEMVPLTLTPISSRLAWAPYPAAPPPTRPTAPPAAAPAARPQLPPMAAPMGMEAEGEDGGDDA
ncbi:unnamed protein product [Prorocentrum cordatum]|uniref:Uncharacterized protein n=1 Tax=Prorocentrum cordatum TaxID=2364126 RepID=A0ABN9SQ87_9DINO|nr:unnamed protein product [Polarella glacialis]